MSRSFAHFEGKTVPDHLKEARLKGHRTSAEVHGVEAPGWVMAGTDAMKETALYLTMLWIALSHLSIKPVQKLLILGCFSLGLLIWKTSRSALLGWVRLERLHRLIREEHSEIQHNRLQEKEELKQMYYAKGLKGKLLDDVVEILMADDNRLLQIMLEEELGLSLEFLEHPLKQATGAFFGVLVSSIFLLLPAFLIPSITGIFLAAIVLIFISSFISTRFHRNELIKGVIWALSLFCLSAGIFYFLIEYLVKVFW